MVDKPDFSTLAEPIAEPSGAKPDFSGFAETEQPAAQTGAPDFSTMTEVPAEPLGPGPMRRMAGALDRIWQEAKAGTEGSIQTTGFGFNADTEKFFADLGMIAPKPTDAPHVAALKIANRGLLETPARAMDAAMAGIQGVLRGVGQVAKEFGADDTGVNRAIRDVNVFLMSRLGEGAQAIPKAEIKARVAKEIPKKRMTEADAALDAALEQFAKSIGVDADAVAAQTVLSRKEILTNKILDDTYYAKVIERMAGDTTRLEPPALTSGAAEPVAPYVGPGARLLERRPGPTTLEMEQGAGGEFTLRTQIPAHGEPPQPPRPPGALPGGIFGALPGKGGFIGPPAAPRGHILRPALELRLLRGTPSLVEQVFETGPVLRDVKQNIRFTGTPGLTPLLNQVGKEKLPNLMLYFAARGVDAVRRTRPTVELPAGMDSATVTKVLELGDRNPGFRKAFDEYQRFNRDVLNLAVDSGVLAPKQRDAFVNARMDYVPFYRVMEEALDGKPRAATSVLRRLRGGPQNVAEIANNLYSNAQMWTELSMRNYAKRELYDLIDQAKLHQFAQPIARDIRMGKALPGDIAKLAEGLPEDIAAFLRQGAEDAGVRAAIPGRPRGENVDVVYRDGKAQYYRINDPIMAESLMAFGPQNYNTALKIAGGFKTTLTRAVTMAPPFVIKNAVRDTQTAYINFPAEYGMFVPGLDTLRGLISRVREDANYREAMANGVGFATLYKGERSVERAANVKAFYERNGIPVNRVIDTAEKVMHLIEEGTSAIELANRLRVYEKTKQASGDTRMAALMGRDVTIDFGKTGSDAATIAAVKTLPFFNPYLQGISKVGQTFGEHPVRTTVRGLTAITVPTLTLYAANKEDPDYWALPDWVRDMHWVVPDNFYVPGTQKTGYFFIPRSLDYGPIFAAVPERIMEAIETKHGKRFAGAMIRMLSDQYTPPVVPQIVAPVVGLAMNKRYPDAPIVPERLADVRPSEQFTPYTSQTLVELARVLHEDTGIEMSPAKVEAMIQGYFGTLGLYALDATDALTRQFVKGEPPERRLDDRPMLRNFYAQLPFKNTQYGADFYTLMSEARSVSVTFQKIAKEAREPDLSDRDERLLGVAKASEAVGQAVGQLNAEARRIYGDAEMSGAEKRRRLDELLDSRNRLFEDFMRGVPEAVLRDVGLPLMRGSKR